MRNIELLFICLIIFLNSYLAGCKANENLTTNYKVENIIQEEVEVDEEKILFLNYKIAKESGGEINLSVINQIINKGNIKGYNSNIQYLKIGNLKFIQQDLQGNELDVYYLSNPLTREVEFVDENGQFQRKVIQMDSSEFGIRLQLQNQCRKVVVELIKDSELNTIELLTTEIK